MTTKLSHRKPPKLARAQVLKRVDITPDLLIMWIERPSEYTFKAGQYCTIGIDGIERAYSIVSAPHEDMLELFVELVPGEEGGMLTPKIWDLKVGDSVSIRPRAKGIFTLKPHMPNQLLVSTVTGVVPYISFLRGYVEQKRGGHRFYLLIGASYQDEFTYDGELIKLAGERPELLTFVPTVSRPAEERNENWAGEVGRVNTIVEGYAERFSLAPEDTLVYACGHPGMIEDVKARMIPRGYAVEEERFWKED